MLTGGPAEAKDPPRPHIPDSLGITRAEGVAEAEESPIRDEGKGELSKHEGRSGEWVSLFVQTASMCIAHTRSRCILGLVLPCIF